MRPGQPPATLHGIPACGSARQLASGCGNGRPHLAVTGPRMSKFGAMAKYRITRESLLDGSHHARVRVGQPPHVRFMTDEERRRHVAEMLARAPRPGRIWVFGYGSLMWNPAFHYVERRTARIHGFHRQFCLWARGGRGSPERPGLMLSLESGGSCTGVAYRIAPEAAESELDVLWRREMASWSYRPVWVTAYTRRGRVPAIVFAVNRSHERYVPRLDAETVARYLATGAGLSGSCREYLFDTAEHLRELGIRDRRMEALARRVRELRPEEEPPSP
jgi:cation transport protein ChaC